MSKARGKALKDDKELLEFFDSIFMAGGEDSQLSEPKRIVDYTAESIIITETPYTKLFAQFDELRKKRIIQAEIEQGVKIDFDSFLLAGTDENGRETIQDQHGNKIILAPMTEEETRLCKELENEQEKRKTVQTKE